MQTESKMAGTIYTGLKYSTKDINRNFRITAFTTKKLGVKRINTAVGVSGLIRLVGIDFANKFIERAFNSSEDKEACKLRSGIRITFYAK